MSFMAAQRFQRIEKADLWLHFFSPHESENVSIVLGGAGMVKTINCIVGRKMRIQKCAPSKSINRMNDKVF